MENKNQEIQLAKDEAVVTTLEAVMAQLKESDDVSVNRDEIAADLLVAKMALDFEKTGKIAKEQVKNMLLNYFSL